MTENVNRIPDETHFIINGVRYEATLSIEDGQGWMSMPDYYTATLKGHPELSVRIEEVSMYRHVNVEAVIKQLRDKVMKALSRGKL